MDKENIEDFIQFFADDKVIERGKELLQKNAISFSHYVKKTDTLHFKVKGTKLYTVRIKNLLNNNINASCSCPYNWGGICKHTVAVLYDIIENRDESIFIEKSQTQLVIHEKRDTSPFVIDDYRIVDERFITKHLKNQSVFVFTDYSLKKISFKQNLLQFYVTEEKSYFQIENYKVELYYKDNTFYINSNQNGAVPKGYLRVSEAFILDWLSTFNFSKIANFYFINNQLIKFPPREKAVYHFFLDRSLSEGLLTNDLYKHKDKLIALYKLYARPTDHDKAENIVDKIIDTGENAFSEITSKIRKELYKVFGK